MKTKKVTNGNHKTRVTAEDFVKVWERGDSVKAVEEKLGVKNAGVRAGKYRKLGIPLKKFPRGGGARIDVAGLTALVKKLAD